MYQINFNQPCNIYFIGIGGISMSGLAEILLHNRIHALRTENLLLKNEIFDLKRENADIRKEAEQRDKENKRELERMIKELREDVFFYRLKRKIRHISGKDQQQ